MKSQLTTCLVRTCAGHFLTLIECYRFSGFYGLQFAIKALDYGLSPAPFRKLSEIDKGDDSAKKTDGRLGSNGPGGSSAPSISKMPLRSSLRSVGSLIYDGAELICSFRGIGWDYGTGTGLQVPRQWKNVHNRKVFILQAILTFAFYTLVIDFIHTIIRLSPIGSPQGGSIFAFGNNTLEKYAISTGYTILSGLLIALGGFRGYVLNLAQWVSHVFHVGTDQGYYISMICGVTIFHSDPALWPPLSDNPWFSTSLHELWGRRWHQLIRRSLLITGGAPFVALSHLLGLSPDAIINASACGVCLMSGFLHTWDYYALSSGKTAGLAPVLFFGGQGVGLALEREWRRRTGRRVGGLVGWVWVVLWTVGASQACSTCPLSLICPE